MKEESEGEGWELSFPSALDLFFLQVVPLSLSLSFHRSMYHDQYISMTMTRELVKQEVRKQGRRLLSMIVHDDELTVIFDRYQWQQQQLMDMFLHATMILWIFSPTLSVSFYQLHFLLYPRCLVHGNTSYQIVFLSNFWISFPSPTISFFCYQKV